MMSGETSTENVDTMPITLHHGMRALSRVGGQPEIIEQGGGQPSKEQLAEAISLTDTREKVTGLCA